MLARNRLALSCENVDRLGFCCLQHHRAMILGGNQSRSVPIASMFAFLVRGRYKVVKKMLPGTWRPLFFGRVRLGLNNTSDTFLSPRWRRTRYRGHAPFGIATERRPSVSEEAKSLHAFGPNRTP